MRSNGSRASRTPEKGLSGKVVLITGAASGIGLALSSALRHEGCHVVELDHTSPEGDERNEPGRRIRVVGDVADPEANIHAVETATREFGRLDAFVGNAGVHDGGARVTDLSTSDLRDLTTHVLRVNVVGYVVGASAAAGAVAASRGTMVFTLSDASFVVSGNGAGLAYAASKHAGVGVVRGLAAQLAPDVRVNAVAPGGVLTSLKSVSVQGSEQPVFIEPERAEAAIRDLNPLGTVLSPEDLVPHYRYLLTDASQGLTGHVLRPDGGLCLV